MRALAVAPVLLVGACFSPGFEDGAFVCAPGCPPGLSCNAEGRCVTGLDPGRDAAALDGTAVPVADASNPSSDGDTQLSGCPEVPGTLSLYPFSGGAPADVVGGRSGTLRGDVAVVPGPPGCGDAVDFPAAGDNYFLVADDPIWDLDSGSIELWLQSDGKRATLLSRDASGADSDGHFQLGISEGLHVWLRLQGPGEQWICHPTPVVPGRWTHVGVNFGPEGAQLFVDGVAGALAGTIDFEGTRDCVTSSALGIAGNDNAWVIGASNGNGADGDPDPGVSYQYRGAIDHVRIGTSRVDFGARAYP